MMLGTHKSNSALVVAAAAAAAFLASSAGVVDAIHYESPPCGPDETELEMDEIDAVVCAPQCHFDYNCPKDPPDGVQNKPGCALHDPDDETARYCAILCKPLLLEGFDCGFEMHCLPIPGWEDGDDGFGGICAYPMAATTKKNNELWADGVARPAVAMATLATALESVAERGGKDPSQSQRRPEIVIRR